MLFDVLLDRTCHNTIGFLEPNSLRLHYESFRDFTGFLIRYLDDSAVIDKGVSEQMRLKLCWCDLMTLMVSLEVRFFFDMRLKSIP